MDRELPGITIYNKLKTPPAAALSKIDAGDLKGKTNIDPQWRIEAMTEVFGLCGFGWDYKVLETKTQECEDGRIILYMGVQLRVKLGDQWSEPIYGYGGDMLVNRFQTKGLTPNDEAYKMCLTDALGNAMRYLGMAADVYQGKFDNKYGRANYGATAPVVKSSAPKTTNVPPKGNSEPYTKSEGGSLMVKSLKDGQWLVVEEMTLKQMQWAYKCEKYAAAQSQIAGIGKAKFGDEWQ